MPLKVNMTAIRFCADECAKQKSGEKSVFRMIQAYELALIYRGKINLFFVNELAITIDPEANKNGLRNQPVSFADSSVVKVPTEEQMNRLFTYGEFLSPDALYQTFEEIHPYNDGNGRIGAILWNHRNGSLRYPIAPPEFKK